MNATPQEWNFKPFEWISLFFHSLQSEFPSFLNEFHSKKEWKFTLFLIFLLEWSLKLIFTEWTERFLYYYIVFHSLKIAYSDHSNKKSENRVNLHSFL